MPRRLIVTDRAAADLDGIYRWQLQPGSGAASVRRLRAIGAAIRRLRRIPCLYPHGEHPGTRVLHVAGHTVVYQVEPDTGRSATAGDVLVLRIFGPGQAQTEL